MNINDIRTLAAKRIFFGHQSVGGNILDGIQEVQKETNLPVVELGNPDDIGFDRPGLFHAMVGSNGDPTSKIKEFERIVRGGVGGKADIAFFKFCYVDFTVDTDVTAMFQEYKKTMASLAKAYPETRFVHVTVPLRAAPGGTKSALRSILGRGPGPLVEANLQREEFNQMLRREYGGKQSLFDLAAVESTRADGTRAMVKTGGRNMPVLVSEYTDDGKHLNEQGRKYVARHFLAFLEAQGSGSDRQVAATASNR